MKPHIGSNGIRTHDHRDTGAMLYQLSYEATHWEQGQFIEFISSRAVKSCEIHNYEIIHICTAVVDEPMGSNPVEALIFFRLLSNCLNWKIYCDDHTSLSVMI